MQAVNLREPVDARAVGSPNVIVNEKHIIGEDNDANFVTLEEVPVSAAGVTISGYTRVTSAPAALQFVVYAVPGDRIYGKVEFNAANNNSDVQISYSGLGTPNASSVLRRIRQLYRDTAVNFMSYRAGFVADYDAMMTAMMADITDGQACYFPGNKTYTFDKTNLGSIGHLKMRWIGGPGCIFKKKTTGTFGATNTEHMFYDKASTTDGLTVEGIEFDLSRSSATNGNTVSAFMLVRHDNLTVRWCKFRDGIEEGLKLYKCQNVRVEDSDFSNIRNNGIQCHAPSSDSYTGAKGNRGWENIWIHGCTFTDIDDGAGGAADGEGVTFNSTDNAVTCKGAWVFANYFLRCIRGIHSEANPSGGSACWMDDLHIFDNTVRDSKCHGIILGGARYSYVQHNTVINPGQTGNVTGGAFGIKMTGTNGGTPQASKHCKVDHNTVYDDRGGSAQMTVGIFITVSEDFTVEHNDSQGAITGQNHICIPDDCKRGFFMPGHVLPSVKVKITAGQSNTNHAGAAVNVPFATAGEKWNKWGATLHDNVNPERFKVPTYSVDGGTNNGGLPGIWRMRCNLTYADGGDATKRQTRCIYSNGSELVFQDAGAAFHGDDTSHYIDVDVEMTMTEYLRIQSVQGTGADLAYSDNSWAQFDYSGHVKPNA